MGSILSLEPIHGNTTGNISSGGMVAASNGWLFYYTYGSPARIYRCKEDGSSRGLINEGAISSLNVIGDWIYYMNLSDGNKLYKIKIDGTGRTRLTSEAVMKTYIQND